MIIRKKNLVAGSQEKGERRREKGESSW